jgi:polyether ionophore transport system ATP-binding protein
VSASPLRGEEGTVMMMSSLRSLIAAMSSLPGRRDRCRRLHDLHKIVKFGYCGVVATPISASGLRKSFGQTVALDGLELTVEAGEVHGFLGPNGAGKTTTIRILLGLLRADAGDVRLLGGDPWYDAVGLHRRLAYVPGEVNLWPNITGGEAIDLLARLRRDLDRKRRDELLERFDLDPTKKARTYSKGNRQKVALVAGLVSNAELLVLDEPTSGLDPLMEVVFQECIREVQAEGRTVLLSSHILAEVEALCHRVTIIRLGRTVETGTLGELRHLTRTSIVAETATAPTDLDALPGVHNVHVRDGRVEFDVDTGDLDTALRRLTELGVRSLTSHPPTLEEMFLRHYGDEVNQLVDVGVADGDGDGARASRDVGASP